MYTIQYATEQEYEESRSKAVRRARQIYSTYDWSVGPRVVVLDNRGEVIWQTGGTLD